MEKNLLCPTCDSSYTESIAICNTCGFPFNGTEKEKAIFIGQQISKKGKVSETSDKIKRARIILWIIGALTIINFFVSFTTTLDLILGFVFIGFGFLTFKAPKLAIIVPTSLLVLFYTLSAIADLANLMQGLLFKIIFLFGLGYAIVSMIQADKIKKESEFLKKQKYA